MTAEVMSSIDGVVKLDDIEIDFSGNTISKAGQSTSIEPKVMAVLSILVSRKGQVVTREDILDQVWPTETGGDESLSRNISVLRQELGDARPYRIIKTIPKKGYRFDANVEFPESQFETLKSHAIDVTEHLLAPTVQSGTKHNWQSMSVIGAVFVAIFIVASGVAFLYSNQAPQQAEQMATKPSIDRRAIRSAMEVLIENNMPADAAISALVETGDFDDAIARLKNSHQFDERGLSISQSKEILHQIGALAFDRRPDTALTAYKELVGMNANDWLASYQLANLYYIRNEKEEARKHINSALRSKDSNAKTRFRMEIVQIRINSTDFLKDSERLFNVAERARDAGFKDVWSVASFLGIMYHSLLRYDSDEQYAREAPAMFDLLKEVIQVQRDLSLDHELSITINGRGVIERKMNQPGSAEESFLTALEIEQAIGRPYRLHRTLSNLAYLKELQKKFEEANLYNEKAIETLRSAGLLRNMPFNWQLAARISQNQGQQSEACNSIAKAIAMRDEVLLSLEEMQNLKAELKC